MENKYPKISIITVTFNSEKYLDKFKNQDERFGTWGFAH
jgi:GT2 family glycosyltransferase